MKQLLIISIVAALLGGCVIAPGRGDNRDGYRERGYYYNDGNYRDYSYRSDRDYPGYRDHGG